jgi:hypothetical protein
LVICTNENSYMHNYRQENEPPMLIVAHDKSLIFFIKTKTSSSISITGAYNKKSRCIFLQKIEGH